MRGSKEAVGRRQALLSDMRQTSLPSETPATAFLCWKAQAFN